MGRRDASGRRRYAASTATVAGVSAGEVTRRLGQAATAAGGAVLGSPALCSQDDGVCVRVAGERCGTACAGGLRRGVARRCGCWWPWRGTARRGERGRAGARLGGGSALRGGSPGRVSGAGGGAERRRRRGAPKEAVAAVPAVGGSGPQP